MKRYVIGDIHGCYEQLVSMYYRIRDDAGGEPHKMIFVGDYVDRGPASKEVVNLLSVFQEEGHVCLMGNHEEILLRGDFTYAESTIASFGTADNKWAPKIPGYALEWMGNLPTYYEDDTIIVAHAGAKPSIPMENQTLEMLLWYRYQPNQLALLDKHFYHGHTPRSLVETVADRTNVDTACVFGNHLTAAVVGEDGRPTRFIQINA